MILILWNPLDSFLSNKFPDPGTDDLSLLYVIEHLPLHFYILFTMLILFLLLGFYWKRVSYYGMALLITNLVFFVLMRSNYEFYYWVISGPKPGYGGLGAAAEIFYIVSMFVGWFIIDIIIDSIPRWTRQIKNAVTLFGILMSLYISYTHVGPVVVYVMANGW